MDIEACTLYITDPRNSRNQYYSLEDLILIVFSSMVSGYDTPDGMAEFARLKIDWLNQYVNLDRTPCAETLRFFVACLNPDELVKGFSAFVASDGEPDIVAIDGKTMRGTRHSGRDAVHVVSAWSQAQGITLAALESKGKSNEIRTIPEVLNLINVKGNTITTDAMGCQRTIASDIHERGGHYVLQLKNNQANLLREIQAYHHKKERDGFTDNEQASLVEVDKGHGRLEQRCYQQFMLTDWVEETKQWKGAISAVRVERARSSSQGESSEVAWYLSSHSLNAEHMAKAIRGHWEVENKLHWRLDVILKEDANRQASGAVNVAVLKRFCMNLLSKNDTSKRRLKHKIMAAAINDDYRHEILFGKQAM